MMSSVLLADFCSFSRLRSFIEKSCLVSENGGHGSFPPAPRGAMELLVTRRVSPGATAFWVHPLLSIPWAAPGQEHVQVPAWAWGQGAWAWRATACTGVSPFHSCSTFLRGLTTDVSFNPVSKSPPLAFTPFPANSSLSSELSRNKIFHLNENGKKAPLWGVHCSSHVSVWALDPKPLSSVLTSRNKNVNKTTNKTE